MLRIAYNIGAIRAGVVGSFTLQTEALTYQLPTLRRWLETRSGSERATLARLWALPEPAAQSAASLADAMLNAPAVERMLAGLRQRERAALTLVQQHNGSIPAPILEREFGAVRAIADYPNPREYLLALERPAAPTERLWLLGLIQTPEQTRRAYTIPADLLAFLPPAPPAERALALQAVATPPTIVPGDARATERMLLAILSLAQDGRLDVTPGGALSRAALKHIGQRLNLPADAQRLRMQCVRQVASGAGLLKRSSDDTLRPTRAALEWLQLPAFERSRLLLEGWRAAEWDELVQLAGLTIQRGMFRDLAAAKRAVVGLIAQAPAGEWVALDAFIDRVRQVAPDFARPDGRYDTWGLLSRTRQPLDGFMNWLAVEGEQLRAIIEGTLHWLGLVDLGEENNAPVAFRLNALGAALLAGAEPPAEESRELLLVQPNFEIIAPPFLAPYARFQLGRFAERADAQTVETYRITRRSIQSSLQRGIQADDMLRFLGEYSATGVPANVAATLRDWAGQYGRVTLRRGALLATDDPLLLEQIRRDRRVRLPHTEALNAHTWLLREADAPALAERLHQAGYGVAGDIEPAHAPLREHDLSVIVAALEFYAAACETLGTDHAASAALRRRVARLLPEPQQNRAHRASQAALERLREQLAATRPDGEAGNSGVS